MARHRCVRQHRIRTPNIDRLAQSGLLVKLAFGSGWAFFVFADSSSVGTKLPGKAACYSCHATEAAHDNVFTQFYPPIRERLAKVAPPAGSARPGS